MDTSGQGAAWAILSVERALEELPEGEVLEVSVSDPQLAVDLPRVVSNWGGVLLAALHVDGGMRLYFRRCRSEQDQPQISPTPQEDEICPSN